MNSITISFKGVDVVLFYEVKYEQSAADDIGAIPYTVFYSDETKTVKRKKYLLFGPYVYKKKHICLFTIWENANNPNISKEEWREKIVKELQLLERKKELEKGILI